MHSSEWTPPPGVELTDGQITINMDAFEPNMAPFCIDRGGDLVYVHTSCVRVECENGDVHLHWRDGKKRKHFEMHQSCNH